MGGLPERQGHSRRESRRSDEKTIIDFLISVAKHDEGIEHPGEFVTKRKPADGNHTNDRIRTYWPDCSHLPGEDNAFPINNPFRYGGAVDVLFFGPITDTGTLLMCADMYMTMSHRRPLCAACKDRVTVLCSLAVALLFSLRRSLSRSSKSKL